VSQYRDRAVVLRTYRLGEADRIVVLLTQEHGKVRAVAKGVRKTTSRIGARLEPMNHVEVLVKPGRGLAVIDEVKLVSVHHRLHSDLSRMSQGMAMLEAVDRIAPDLEPVPAIFELLRRALATLDQQKSPLMLAAFYLKLLAIEGSAPQLGSCVGCGAADDLVGFDIVQGGTQCGSCRMGAPFSGQALEVLRMILGGDLRRALDLGESPAVHEAHQMVMNMMEAHLERRIRSLGVFDRHL